MPHNHNSRLLSAFTVVEVGRLLGGHRFWHQIRPKVPGCAGDRGRRSQRNELAQQSGGKKGETRTAERQKATKQKAEINDTASPFCRH